MDASRQRRRRRSRPLFGWPDRPASSSPSAGTTCAATPARSRFPAAGATTGESYLRTALREAHEEIGLDPDVVELLGALPPIGTFVTNYKVHPIVGLIEADLEYEPAHRGGAVLALRRSTSCGRLRDAAAGPPRASDPHAHLRGRRPPHLGRHGPHPGRPARAPARTSGAVTHGCSDGCECADGACVGIRVPVSGREARKPRRHDSR